ncbi:hypothetical protein [Microbacterium sp. LWH13-1.2]|uniref:hypothetical protein n=1 Tax=Microbacterium sp. LWH13-1.2 TaxID=3135260 RepID=UPI003139934F
MPHQLRFRRQYSERVNAEPNPPTAWYDRPLVSNVLGGAVVGFLVWFVPWLISESTKARVSLLAYVSVGVGGLILGSVLIPVWRRATWVKLQTFFKWASAIRPVTARKRQSLIDSGYSKRQMELIKAREDSKQPRWNVRAEDHLPGDPALHWLRNQGYEVADVEITTDPAEFILGGEVFFAGVFGSLTGKPFQGSPTEKGLRDGVTFHVSWWDQSGLKYERDLFEAPKEVWGHQIRAVVLAHEKALRDKDTEVKKLREQIASAAAANETKSQQGKDLVEKILNSPTKPPLPLPRWMIAPAPSGKRGEYVLRNSVPRSVAKEVRLEAEAEFKIISAGHWKDLSGTEEKGAVGEFVGVFTSQGETFGVRFLVGWYDEHAKYKTRSLFLGGPNETSKLVDPISI